MARSRKAKPSLRERQTSPGRSIQPPRFILFKLPSELRVLVYKNYFSSEDLMLDPRFRCRDDHPTNLVLKSPLLRSNRVILAEALPVSYQYYLFRIQVPHLRSLKFPPHSKRFPPHGPPQIRRSEDIRYLTPVLPLITRMELMEPRKAILVDRWDTSMAPYLQCLRDYCTKLRFLRLNIILESAILRFNASRQAHIHSKIFGLLAQLVKRLDRLELIFVHTAWYSIRDFFRDIAPNACWIQEASIEVPGNTFQTSFWSLQPGRKALEDIKTSTPPTDAAAPGFSRHNPSPSNHFTSTLDRLRDHRGRFKKPPRFRKPPRITRIKEPPSYDLLALPAELRSLIYQFYFSCDERPYSANIQFTGSGLAYPTLKLALLQTNRVVFAEALPIFYQSYRFKIQLPYMTSVIFPPPTNRPFVPKNEAIRYMTPDLSRITRMELEDTRIAHAEKWDGILSAYVQCLLDFCPQLRFLRLDIGKNPKHFWGYLEQYYRLLDSTSLLAQLWERLDRLEVSVLHCSDTSEAFRELIAPKYCWTRGCVVNLGSGYLYETAIWSLVHTAKGSDETEQKEIEAV